NVAPTSSSSPAKRTHTTSTPSTRCTPARVSTAPSGCSEPTVLRTRTGSACT
ncbi:hypothetical protein IscW_ISCW009463, partial [Ixodes scapularis]